MKEVCQRNFIKFLGENGRVIVSFSLKIICGLLCLYIGILNPYLQNTSVPNAQRVVGSLIGTEIATHYSEEELRILNSFEMKKHGKYEFNLNGKSYKVMDKNAYLKVNKKATVIYNSSNPSECIVRYNYWRVLHYTLLGLFLIMCAIMPKRINRRIDVLFSNLK